MAEFDVGAAEMRPDESAAALLERASADLFENQQQHLDAAACQAFVGKPVMDSELFEALGFEPARVFKTLLAADDRQLVVGIIPVDRKLDLKALAVATGHKKLAMANPEVAERATGMVVGGISPIGQKRLLPTVLDDSALAFETILVSGGRRGLDVELAPGDLIGLVGATVAAVATG